MSRGFSLMLKATGLLIVGFAAWFVWFVGSADVTGYSDREGLYSYNCNDAQRLEDHGCANQACRGAIDARGLVPPTYELRITDSSSSPGKGVEVKGYIKSKDFDSSFPRKAVVCTYANGKVGRLTIDNTDIKVALP